MDTIVLAAMVMLLIGGMFDLSVDGVVNMTGVIIGALLVAGISVWLSIASGIAAALIVGLVNGIAVTKFKMNPLMTTLGLVGYTGTCVWGDPRPFQPQLSATLYRHRLCRAIRRHHADLVRGRLLVALAIWMLAKTKFGYHVYATGGNREGARLHGVKVDRVTITSFVLVALARALTMKSLCSPTPTTLSTFSGARISPRKIQAGRIRPLASASAPTAINTTTPRVHICQ